MLGLPLVLLPKNDLASSLAQVFLNLLNVAQNESWAQCAIVQDSF